MHDEEAAAVGGFVNVGQPDLDAAEMLAREAAEELVVVAGDVDDLRALARLAQEGLHHVVVRLGPVPGTLEPPPVHDVADEIDLLGVVRGEESEQPLRLRRLGSEMHVRDEERAEMPVRALAFDRRHGFRPLRLALAVNSPFCIASM